MQHYCLVVLERCKFNGSISLVLIVCICSMKECIINMCDNILLFCELAESSAHRMLHHFLIMAYVSLKFGLSLTCPI